MTGTDFNYLVMKLSRRLYVQAYNLLGDQSGSEDAVQEVFVKLWKMKENLGKYDSIDALAITITRNYCLDQLRRQRYSGSNDAEASGKFEAGYPTPHEQLERNETMAIIEKIVESLPGNYRDIIRLKDIDGLSYEEISEKTAMNINTLRVNLSRARKMVRDEFEKYTYERKGNKRIAGEIL